MNSIVKQNLSFTLVELLIVIGILAVLTAAVFLVINPVEYLKQARDTTRMSDLSSIDKALSVLETQGITSFGTDNTVYVSVPDTSDTCANLGLPDLPSGYFYACVTSVNLQKINGTGWIPVDFAQSPALSFSNLPIDSVNSTSTGNYYTYTPGGSWELATAFESAKYKFGGGADRASTDGGQFIELYEVGPDKTLLPVNYGGNSLIGYWSFDVWSDSTNVYDNSGGGTEGTWHGTGSTRYVAHGNGWAANFNGTDDYIDVGRGVPLSTNPFTVSLWYKGSKIRSVPFSTMGTYNYNGIIFNVGSTLIFNCNNDGRDGSLAVSDDVWHMLTVKRNGNILSIYIDGTQDYEGNFSACNADIDTGYNSIIGKNIIPNYPFSGSSNALGLIDDVRIYNRILSAAEIQAIYDATK